MAEGWDWLGIFRDDYGHEYGNGGGDTTGVIDVKEQIASDEILAEELQELENLLIDSSSDEFTDMAYMGSSSMTGEYTTLDFEEEVTRQDQVDPDNMTYEELQTLEETVGNEGRGLSDEVISTLPSSKYKSGFFSKKRDHTNCVICQAAYKNQEKLITLPCQHYFHKDCITTWLKIQKTCPVCKDEVSGP